MIKIKEHSGFEIGYSPGRREFVVLDKDGRELAKAETQKDAEEKAEAQSKSDFKRVPVFQVGYDGSVTYGDITSINLADRSAWVSMQVESGRVNRHKIYLTESSGGGFYERTSDNLANIEVIKVAHKEIQTRKELIQSIIKGLEKPIGMAYFEKGAINDS